MTNVWCVHADFGTYTKQFVEGGYVGIGWMSSADLTSIQTRDAAEVALEAGFPRIGLINGRQLVDLLIKHWGDTPPECQERLGLKPGLVRT